MAVAAAAGPVRVMMPLKALEERVVAVPEAVFTPVEHGMARMAATERPTRVAVVAVAEAAVDSILTATAARAAAASSSSAAPTPGRQR